MFLGIDIGGTKIEYASFTEKQVSILGREATPGDYQSLIRQISSVAAKLDGLDSVGVGLPGTFTTDKIIWVPNISYLNGNNLAGDLSEKFGVGVTIGNDAQLALLGESWKGAASNVSDAVLLSIGTGIGGAIMAGGKIIKGNNGAAGAIGWLNLNINEEPVENHGYLEYHASGSALTRIGKSMSPPITSYEIVDKAKQGEPACVNIMNEIGKLLGASVGAIASILDPKMVIVSGGLSDAFDSLEAPMMNSFRKYSSNGITSLPIVKSQLGNKSGVYGAVRLAMIQDKAWI